MVGKIIRGNTGEKRKKWGLELTGTPCRTPQPFNPVDSTKINPKGTERAVKITHLSRRTKIVISAVGVCTPYSCYALPVITAGEKSFSFFNAKG